MTGLILLKDSYGENKTERNEFEHGLDSRDNSEGCGH